MVNWVGLRTAWFTFLFTNQKVCIQAKQAIMSTYTFHWQHKYQVTVYNSNTGMKKTYSSDSLKDIIEIYLDSNGEGMYFRFLKNK